MSPLQHPPRRIPGSVQDLLRLLVIGFVYAAAAKLSLLLASINPSASPIWPPTGLALAAMLLWGYRIWPAILVGAFVANAITAGSIFTSLSIAGGNTLESLVAATLINRWSSGLATFETPAGVARFTAICFVPSTLISATVGVLSLSLGGYADWARFLPIWLTWWMGDLAGALLVTPLIVLWSKNQTSSRQAGTALRSGAAFAAAIVIGLIAFGPPSRMIENSGALAFLAIVPLMWTALHHSQRDTATTAFILAGFAVWGAMSRSGPFAQANLNDALLLLLAFMISISVPSLALSARVAMHERHERHIEALMLELSHRSKNLLTVVQSVARQVAKYAKSFDDFDEAFAARIGALAATHDLLVTRNWQGAEIREAINSQLTPFRQANDARFVLEGPSLVFKPKAVELLGLALHELATNATKYGALSVPTGLVKLSWAVEPAGKSDQQLRMIWSETGGPSVQRSAHEGFGHMVITQLVPKALDGSAEVICAGDGLQWILKAPMASILERSSLAGKI